MTNTRDDMLNILEQHKRLIRQRTVDPATLSSSSKSLPYNIDLNSAHKPSGKNSASHRQSSLNPNILHASENMRSFLEHYYRMFCAFAEDSSRLELELTTDLTSQDRRALHALAEACNLAHHSSEDTTKHQRALMIKKDVLFFKNKNGYREVDVEALAQRISAKDSKFDVRRIRSVDPAQREIGEVGSYDDDEALTKILRFKRFTDEYRHAVDIGYSQEEAITMGAGGGEAARLEDILRRPAPGNDDSSDIHATVGYGDFSRISSKDGAKVESPLALAASPSSTASRLAGSPLNSSSTLDFTVSPAAGKSFIEHCRGCGSRGAVDYPIEGWSCQKYCACCARPTIWSLSEVAEIDTRPRTTGTAASRRRGYDIIREGEVLSDDDQHASKRPRVVKESIDRESDEFEEIERHVEEIDVEEEDPITVEDVVDMACTNDFAAEDTNWLRRFASVNASHLSDSVFFCIKYEDMLSIYARFERTVQNEERKCQRDKASIATKRGGSHGEIDASVTAECIYVVIRESPLENLKVTDLIQKMCSVSFSFASDPISSAASAEVNNRDCGESALQHIGLSFLNASVYGSATTALCQLRPRIPSGWSNTVPTFLCLNKEELLRMQQKHGQNHFYLASSLGDAVRFATQ